LTRAKVIQIGFLVFFTGGAGYLLFRLIGISEIQSGIAAEALLILIILGWTASYFYRVISGKMTFIEQRKRYRNSYEKITNEKLEKKFESLSNDEKIRLIKELEK
tara:strand:- start:526 stop:840 length:315 start_codon:yes stop_codon:yes gene_type:complete